MVMVITGILFGIVAVFIARPVQGYADAVRRAELTDAANASLRRMGRDIRSAVPNSVRQDPQFLEYLPSSGGGRYRASGVGDQLDFTAADASFDILGPPMTFLAGDQIVVSSWNSSGTKNNAYSGNTAATDIRVNVATAQANVTNVSIAVADQHKMCPPPPDPCATSPSQRFQVIPADQQAVTYACEGLDTVAGDGTGTLKRYWHYGINAAQAKPPSGGSSALLVNYVSACNIDYSQGDGLVSITLQLTRGGESVSLYHEIHVNNVP